MRNNPNGGGINIGSSNNIIESNNVHHNGVSVGAGYFSDGVYRTWGGLGVPSIAAGAAATVGSDCGRYSIPNGTHTIMAHVDDVNRFAGSNETNNQLSQTITVGGTDTTRPTVSITTAVARDAAGNTTTSAGVSVTVSNGSSPPPPISGTTYYISPTGNDGNAGTITSPFRTLQKAHDVAGAGATIYMRGGIYNVSSQQTLSRSGTSGKHIKVFNYPGELPVLDASSMPAHPSDPHLDHSDEFCIMVAYQRY